MKASISHKLLFLMNLRLLLASGLMLTAFLSINAAAIPKLNEPPTISISCINDSYNGENMSPFYYIVYRQVLCSAETYDPEGYPVTVSWDFGNGRGITDASGTVYKESGIYTITAYASDGFNETSTSIDFYAKGSENIRLNCAVSGMTVTCNPLAINISTPDTGAIHWGDGTFSQVGNSGSSSSASSSSLIDTGEIWAFDEPITHTYTETGSYSISLSYQAGFQRGTDSSEIDISGTDNQPPAIEISCENYSYNTEFFAPFYYIVNRRVMCSADTSDPEGDAVTVHWDYGDGGAISDYSMYAYKESGTYTITAYASDGINEISTSINFNAIGYENVRLNCEASGMTVTCNPTTVNISALNSGMFSWGDGTASYVGSSGSSSSSSSSSSPVIIEGKTWSFNEPITHTYAETGTYNIGLSYVAGYQHGSDSTKVTIDGSTTPAIDASVFCRTDYIDTTVPADGPIDLLSEVVVCEANILKPSTGDVTIKWDAGDGSNLIERTRFNHTYKDPGNYTIKAIISDGTTTAEFSTTHVVAGNGEPPTVTLECETQQHTVNCSVHAADPDTDTLSAMVGWGDGDPDIFPVLQENVSHTYASDLQGKQQIFVTVFDGANSNTAVFSVDLESQPQQDVSCEYKIVSEWTDHFLGQLIIMNNGAEALNTWDVTLSYTNNSIIDQHWGALLSGSNPYTLTPLSWNQRVMPAQAVSIGFIGINSRGQAVVPTIGGSTCSHD